MLEFFGNRFVPRRLRDQLLALLVLALGPILLVQVGVYLAWYQTRGTAEIEANVELARSVASLFSTFVQDIVRQELPLGVSLSDADYFTVEHAENLLRVSAEENPVTNAFFWAAPDGTVLASSDPRAIGVNEGVHPYFQEIQSGKPWSVSNLIEDDVSGAMIFTVARGIRDPEGQLLGVVIAAIDRAQLPLVFASIVRSEGGSIALFDRQGQPVFHQPGLEAPSEAEWYRKDPLLAAALRGEEARGTIFYDPDAEERFAGRVPIASIGWVAGASRPVRLTFAPLFRSLALVIGLALLAVGLSVLLSRVIYRRISENLQLLQEHAAAVGMGRLDHHVEIPGVIEFGLVAEAFNDMAVKLKRVQDAVREANAMLEERVEARTAELRAANAALRIEIAERERAQQALFAQSKELEGFYRHTVTPLVFLDRDFNFIRVNDAYARTCLREVSEFPGHNHFEFYPSAELEGRFREVVETGRPYEVFARPFTFPDHPEWGITYWNLSLSPVLDAKGGVEFLVFSLEDVTARTVAERRSEVLNMAQALFMTKPTRKEYLDAVVKVVQDWTGCENVGVRVVDDRCEIAYESYLGFSEGFMDIENHISLDRDACICVRVVAGILDAEEAAVKTANGSFCCNNTRAWMEELPAERRLHYRGYCVACGYQSVAVIPIRHFNDPLGAIHLADTRPNLVPPDTVEFLESLALLVAEAIRRFNVEEALRRSQARLAEAQRIAHLGSWEWHVASGELRWSDEVFRILGAPPQSFVPTYARFLDVVHPEDRTRVEEAVDLALRQVSGYDCEHRILRPNGEIRIVRDQGEVTFDDSGAPVSMLGTVMDITEQVYAQEQAQLHQQKLLQADKMVSLGILVSGVAHEINNPNHSIMANVGALAEVWQSVQPILDRFEKDFGDFVLGGFEYSESRDKIPEMFSNALVNSKRIELIVNELRDFARYSPQDKMAAVDVNAVVQSASILVSNLTRKHTAHFVLEYGTLLPPVKGNYQRLEQVIINLVQNACQSLPDRSRSVRVITSFDADSDQVRLEVHDEGVGIPAKDLIHLGDPFFTSKRGLGGMGLGLWISFNIVREHGGTLTFTSEEGAGTCALVTLPAMPGQISESGGEAPRKGDA